MIRTVELKVKTSSNTQLLRGIVMDKLQYQPEKEIQDAINEFQSKTGEKLSRRETILFDFAFKYGELSILKRKGKL